MIKKKKTKTTKTQPFSAVFLIEIIVLLNEIQNSLVFKYIVKIQEIKFRNELSIFSVQSQKKIVLGLEYSPPEQQK